MEKIYTSAEDTIDEKIVGGSTPDKSSQPLGVVPGVAVNLHYVMSGAMKGFAEIGGKIARAYQNYSHINNKDSSKRGYNKINRPKDSRQRSTCYDIVT